MTDLDIENVDPLIVGSPRLVGSSSEPIYGSSSRCSSSIVPNFPVRSSSYPTPTYSVKDSGHFEITSLLPPLLRRISSNSSSSFFCDICLENHSLSEAFSINNCEQNHKFCRSSLTCMLNSYINDGILNCKCPRYAECSGVFSNDEIRSLVDENVFQKYQRFKDMRENANYRECPRCAESTLGDPDNPQIICSKCALVYCHFHSNAHPTISCQAYTRQQARSEMKNRSFIQTITIQCPNCHVETEKSGGCNHMTCQHCGQNWCWLCGQKMEGNFMEHYDVGSLCYGGLLAATPSHTCCCFAGAEYYRRMYFVLVTSWQFPAIAVILLVFLGLIMLGVAVSLALLPLTLMTIAVGFCFSQQCEFEWNYVKILLGPAFVTVGILSAAIMFSLQTVWAVIATLYTLLLLLLSAVGCSVNTDGLCGGNSDRFMEVWLFPLIFVVGALKSPIQFVEQRFRAM